MDGSCFDALARSLTAAGSRRRALTAVLTGGLGLLGLAQLDDAGAAKSGKCKPVCSECKKCKKGDCEKKNGKKVCKKGKCRPKSAGTPCTAFPGGACQNGTCVDLQADEVNCGSVGTVCTANQVCQAGSCFPSSTCPASTTQLCPSGSLPTLCGSNPGAGVDCLCSRSAEGNVVCVTNFDGCGTLTACTSSASCAAGSACVAIGAPCCPGGPAQACLDRCPVPTT
jgi:hypothetical protein